MRVRHVLTTAGLLLASLLAGCGPAPVVVSAGPFATAPICADVILDLPDQLAGLTAAPTTAQAARAFVGDGKAIVITCGVEPPGPTTTNCMTISTDTFTVDWLSVAGADGSWTFLTYGRTPAVAITVPAGVSFTDTELQTVSKVVAQIKPTSRCR